MSYNKPSNKIGVDVGTIVASLNNYESGQALYEALRSTNRHTLECIVEQYCQSICASNQTIQYLTSYCCAKPHQDQNTKIRYQEGTIQSRISNAIAGINDTIDAYIVSKKGQWGKSDYNTINIICSKLHSMYRLAHCVSRFDDGSMQDVLTAIEESRLNMIHLVVEDFLGKIRQYNINNERVRYQCQERQIPESDPNKYVIKYGKAAKIDARTIYHYYNMKQGGGVCDEKIEGSIIELITIIVANQQNYNESRLKDQLATIASIY